MAVSAYKIIRIQTIVMEICHTFAGMSAKITFSQVLSKRGLTCGEMLIH